MFKLRAFLAGGMSIFSSLLCGQVQTFSGSTGIITDNNASVYYSAPVTGIGALSGTQSLLSVCIDISHDDLSDLQIYIISPNGTSQRLSNRDLVGNTATNLCFANGAADISTGSSPYSGEFNPDQTLSDFNNGQNANGNWQLRVRDRSAGDNGSVLNWSLSFGQPIPNEQDCAGAIPVCQDIYSNPNSYVGTGAIAGEINAGPSCLNEGEKNDVWYVFRAQTGGQLNFTIIPNDGGDDYDWAVYDLSNNNCEDIYTNASLEVGCDYSGSTSNGGRTGANGGGNNQDEPTITVAQGNTYVLNVSNYSSTQNGYDLNFSASTAQIYDNEPPVLTSIDNSLGCGVDEIEFTFSENIQCSTIEIADFTLTGPGGTYVLSNLISEGCDNGAPFENSFKVSVSPALTVGGDYSLNLVSTSGSVSDNCGNIALATGFPFTMAGISTTTSITETTCLTATNGGATIIGSAGTAPYTYVWDAQAGNSNSSTVNALSVGEYEVTVTDAIGCSAIETVTITAEANPIQSSFSITGNQCNSDQNITFTNTGSTNLSYNYTWDFGNGATASTVNATYSGYASAGLYPVELIISDGECSDTSISNVEIHSDPIATINASNPNCFGESTGTATVAHTSGLAPYAYTWDNGGNSQGITNLSSGDYSVNITDANGCQTNETTTITEPLALSIAFTSSDPVCNNDNTGYVVAQVTEGTSPYTYSWNNGANTDSISNLTAGVYSVNVTDANGCSISDSLELLNPVEMDATITTSNINCNGGNDGEITVVANNGNSPYNYSWYDGQNTNIGSNFSAGTHSVIVSDAFNCSKTFSVDLTEPTALSINLTAIDVNCFGENNGSIVTSISGGASPYSYSWNNGSTTANPNGLIAGTYVITANDLNGCSITDSVVVSQPDELLSALIPVSTMCSGGNDGSITSSVSGGTSPYSYSWNTGETTSSIIEGVGSYTLTTTDANGCSIISTDSITEPMALTLAFTIDSILCYNGANGSISAVVDGGTLPYSYSWNTGSVSNVINGLNAGNYALTVTDANGCSITSDVDLINPTEINITSTITDVNCYGGSDGEISISTIGGESPYTYLWNTGATLKDLSGITANNYSLVVTDANNCSNNFNINLTQPDSLIISTSITNVACYAGNNGAVSSTVSGGISPYAYTWNTGETSNDISNKTIGDYSLTTTDANGCINTITSTISQPQELSGSLASTNTQCIGSNDGSLTASISGGVTPYAYSWNTGEVSNTLNAARGEYMLTITDANGCELILTDSIEEPNTILIDFTVDSVDCYNGSNGMISASVSGGNSPYTYSWSTGESTNQITDLNAGNYVLQITDANGCSASDSVSILNPTALSTTSTITNAKCFGSNDGQIDLTISGGATPYQFDWITGDNLSSVNNLIAGTYTVLITDAKGCEFNHSEIITQPDSITINLSTINTLCFGSNDGEVISTTIGGTGAYTYEWNNSSTSKDLVGAVAGNYSITVIDENSCQQTASTTINEPLVLTGSIQSVSTSCFGATDGTLNATISGGTIPYTYAWDNGNTTTNIQAEAGIYSLQITDANGCSLNLTDSILQPNALSTSIITDSVDCFGGNNGSATVDVLGGTAPYSYNWNTGESTNSIQLKSEGNYTVSIEDANGCVILDTARIHQSEAIDVTFSVQNLTCFENGSGELSIVINGGNAPYTSAWNNGRTETNLANLDAGTYSVAVTDRLGCKSTFDTLISEPSKVSLDSIYIKNVSCKTGDDGALFISIQGGIGLYVYSWSTSESTQGITDLVAGLYNLEVQDANGCSLTDSFSIVEPNEISSTFTTKEPLCFEATNGEINATVTGGNGSYFYLWDTGISSQNLISIGAGSFQLTVVDGLGCTQQFPVQLNQPDALTVIANPSAANCFQPNGSVTSVVDGGTGTTSIAWSNGELSNDILNVNAGIYAITVSDENGCSHSDTVEVLEIGAPTFQSILTEDVLCKDGKTGNIEIETTGGQGLYSYAWNTGATTKNLHSVAKGTYNVVVTDENNCSIDSTIQISEPDAFQISNSETTSAKCFGSTDGSIEINVIGGTAGYTFSWSNGDTIQNINNLATGTYFVNAMDANGCTDFKEIFVPQPNAITVDFNTNHPKCYGIPTGDITANTTGGNGIYNYVWSTGDNTVSINNLTQGSYLVTVSDTNGCTGNGTATITYPENFEVSTVTENATCLLPNGMAEAIALGGTGSFKYFWNGTEGVSTNLTLNQGIHTLVVEDQNLCSVADTFTIQDNGLPRLQNSTIAHANCKQNDGSILLNITNGTAPYQYNWLNQSSTTNELVDLYSGIYSVEITDVNNCKFNTQFIVNDIDGVQASIINFQSPLFFNAKNGFAEVEAISGTMPYTYHWNDSLLQTTRIATNLKSGSFEVEVTDANNCKDTAQIALINPLAIELSSDSIINVSCFNGTDGEILLNVENGVGPYTYLWSDGSTTQNISNANAGSYHVTVFDAVGGRAEKTFVINQPIAIQVTENLSHVTCFNGNDGAASLVIDGGNNNYSINWSNGNSGIQNEKLSAGIYTYAIVDDKNCTYNGEVNIDQSSLITIDFTVADAHCDHYDGSVIADANGGIPNYTYSWDNSVDTKENDSIHAGTYFVLVTDSKGCSVTDSIVVNDLQPGELTAVITDSVACYGGSNGSLELSMNGGYGNFMYSVDNGAYQMNSIFQNISAGKHSIVAIDGKGCEVSDSVIINQPEKIEINITSVLDTTICYGNSVNLSADIEGGTGEYQVEWSDEVIGNNIMVSPKTSTVYMLNVKDSNACIINGGRVKVNVLEQLTMITEVTPATICPGDYATLKASAKGGTGNYTITWLDNNSNDSIRKVSPSYLTHYEVTVTDGCSNPDPSALIAVDVFTTPRMNITSNVNEGCEGIVIDLNHVIIPEPYEVEWEINGPDTNVVGSAFDIESFQYRTAGSYDIAMNIITEDGCKDSVTFEDYIEIYPVPHAQFAQATDNPTYVNSTVQFFDQSQTPFGELEHWNWEIQNDEHYITANEQNPIVEFPDSGSFTTTLTVVNNYGCEDTAQLNVRVDDSYFFYIPNAFTPQSDGLNETYGPVTRGIDNGTYEFAVYDRWGEMIFHTNSPDFWWDGRLANGNEVQMDAYVWTASFRRSTDHKKMVLNGTVSVIR